MGMEARILRFAFVAGGWFRNAVLNHAFRDDHANEGSRRKALGFCRLLDPIEPMAGTTDLVGDRLGFLAHDILGYCGGQNNYLRQRTECVTESISCSCAVVKLNECLT